MKLHPLTNIAQTPKPKSAPSGPEASCSITDSFKNGWQAVEDFASSSLASFRHLFSQPQAPPGMELDVTNDIKSDGHFLGADKTQHGSDPSGLTTVKPSNGKTADETVYLVNGIMTDVKLHQSDMQALADTGKEVIGIHNATAGLVYDLAQCVDDKAGTHLSDNKATTTTTAVIRKALKEKKPLHLVAHSQGALVVCNAATVAKQELMDQGLSEREAQEAMASIKITTFGGAAQYYPDGPAYTHVLNEADLVPMGTGVGVGFLGHPGKEADIKAIDVTREPHDLPERRASLQNWLARYVDRTVHGPQDIYFNHAPWLEA